MKKLSFLKLIILLILFNFASCKKDKDNTPPDFLPNVTGSWRFISATFVDATTIYQYLHVYSDRTYSLLFSEDAGIHDRFDGVISISDKQIGMEESSGTPASVYYNYLIKQDTLTMTRPGGKMVLVRDKTVPDTSVWIKKVSAVTKINAPINYLTDITYDGTLFWYGNVNAGNYIYKITPAGAKDSLNVATESVYAIEYDGTNLWISVDGFSQIKQVNKSTGAVLMSSINLGPWIKGIARDGIYLWCFSQNNNKLYKYNTLANTLADTKSLQVYVEGMAFVNGNLYLACNGMLHKFNTSTFQNVASYELYGYYMGGVAYDGTSFWVAASRRTSSDTDVYEIIKLSGVE